jgi:hypothetical protein
MEKRRCAQLYDSRFGSARAKRAAARAKERMLLHATQAGQLRNSDGKQRVTIGQYFVREIKAALCASPVAQVTNVYS